jgi:hypothetical protein
MLIKSIALAIAVFLPTATLCAQVPHRQLEDSSVKSILQMTPHVGELTAVLRQQRGSQSRAKLDELGDSLAARAVQRSDVANVQSAEAEVLYRSGLPSTAPAEGVPYEGAVDRLVRIHRDVSRTPSAIRAGLPIMMTAMVGFDRVIPYLFSIATSTDSTAPAAMDALTIVADPAMAIGTASSSQRADLRRMLQRRWEQGDREPFLPGPDAAEGRGKQAVPDARAWQRLVLFARKNGWRK